MYIESNILLQLFLREQKQSDFVLLWLEHEQIDCKCIELYLASYCTYPTKNVPLICIY